MKIREIVTEVSSYDQGKDAMDKLLNPSRWSLGPGYEKGKNTMDKILTPSRWFSGSRQSKEKPAVEIKSYQKRQSLINAGSGKQLYQDDIAALKSAYNDTEDAATRQSIKQAYNQKSLDKNQQQLLINLSKQY